MQTTPVLKHLIVLLSIVTISGCLAPQSEQPAIGKGTLVKGLTAGYYHVGNSTIRLDIDRDGYGIWDGRERTKLMASSLGINTWLLQWRIDGESPVYLYAILRADESGAGFLVSYTDKCSAELQESLKRLTGYRDECSFLKPDLHRLGPILSQYMPNVAPSDGRLGVTSPTYETARWTRAPDRAGMLLLQQRKLDDEHRERTRMQPTPK